MLDPSAFRYDQKACVALTVLSERAQDGATIQDVSYASPLGGKVSAYLIVSPAPIKASMRRLIFSSQHDR